MVRPAMYRIIVYIIHRKGPIARCTTCGHICCCRPYYYYSRPFVTEPSGTEMSLSSNENKMSTSLSRPRLFRVLVHILVQTRKHLNHILVLEAYGHMTGTQPREHGSNVTGFRVFVVWQSHTKYRGVEKWVIKCKD